MKEQTCCFTGHRNVPVDKQKEIVARTGAKVRELIRGGYRCFIVGGAIGYDTLAAELLFHLRDVERMGIRVIPVSYTHLDVYKRQQDYQVSAPGNPPA